MKVIVGLGNPGKEYDQTRHNIGFRIADYVNKENGGSFSFDQKSNSEVSEMKINGAKVLLVKPQIFVNNSGKVVKKIIENYKLKIENLVVIHDDLDIPFGKVKASFGRSSAGHKGVESIIKALKTDKFYRIRVGTFNSQIVKIKKVKDKRKKVKGINDFVVDYFSSNEKPKINKVIKDAVQKIISVL
ncbi:MAG: aminoacyl-tRNA hydrolase [Patescibacteria group bacterium]